MTAKEKAQELYDKYLRFTPVEFEREYAKKCALIAIEEIETAIDWHVFEFPNAEYNYWEEVKQEIEKL